MRLAQEETYDVDEVRRLRLRELKEIKIASDLNLFKLYAIESFCKRSAFAKTFNCLTGACKIATKNARSLARSAQNQIRQYTLYNMR